MLCEFPDVAMVGQSAIGSMRPSRLTDDMLACIPGSREGGCPLSGQRACPCPCQTRLHSPTFRRVMFGREVHEDAPYTSTISQYHSWANQAWSWLSHPMSRITPAQNPVRRGSTSSRSVPLPPPKQRRTGTVRSPSPTLRCSSIRSPYIRLVATMGTRRTPFSRKIRIWKRMVRTESGPPQKSIRRHLQTRGAQPGGRLQWPCPTV